MNVPTDGENIRNNALYFIFQSKVLVCARPRAFFLCVACLKCAGPLLYTYDCQNGISGVAILCKSCNVAYYGPRQVEDTESLWYEWPPQYEPQEGRKFWCYRFLGVSACCCSVVDEELKDAPEGDEIVDKYVNVPFLKPEEEVHYFDLSLTPCGYTGCYVSGSVSFWENQRGEMIQRQY